MLSDFWMSQPRAGLVQRGSTAGREALRELFSRSVRMDQESLGQQIWVDRWAGFPAPPGDRPRLQIFLWGPNNSS